MKKTVLAWGVVLVALSFPACQSKDTAQEQEGGHTAQHQAAADSAATAQTPQLAYICPMECEGSASDAPGKCPVCGMDLVKNPKATASADSTALQ